jgi:SAM-dependent methyltransferase
MKDRSSEYLRPYREAVKQFGACFSATLWMSREAQRLRFDVMIGLADFEDGTVLDAGCGIGDMAEQLLKREVKFKKYIGIDAMEELIAEARTRNFPRCEFHAADLVHDHRLLGEFAPDWVCISGTLNTMEENLARDLVSDAFDAAKRGVVFNFLSDRAEPQWLSRDIGPSRRFNTVQWIDWALSKTSLVSFTQDYLEGHDATVVMRKGE